MILEFNGAPIKNGASHVAFLTDLCENFAANPTKTPPVWMFDPTLPFNTTGNELRLELNYGAQGLGTDQRPAPFPAANNASVGKQVLNGNVAQIDRPLSVAVFHPYASGNTKADDSDGLLASKQYQVSSRRLSSRYGQVEVG